MRKASALLTLFIILLIGAKAQTTYEHISNTGIYEFLDELANQGYITLNSTAKPYSRQYIAQKLEEADKAKQPMGRMLRQDLDFYLKAYFLELGSDAEQAYIITSKQDKSRLGLSFASFSGFYNDSLLRFSARPVAGFNYFTNADTSLSHRWIGAEAFAYIGKNLGLYANLRDNHESSLITGPTYFT